MPTVATCQHAVEDLAVERNLDTVAERVASLAENVDVAVFPELALTGFVPDDRIHEAAVRTDGPAGDRLRGLAQDHDVELVVGFAERDGDDVYNAAAHVAPDGTTTVYRKRHLWGAESAVFEAGEERVVVESAAGEAGILTCYDLNFVADSAAFTEDRIETLFVVGAWPATHAANWRLLVRARALDGVRWAVGCGRTGRRDVEGARTLDYAGRSLVVRPDGVVRAELATQSRDLVVDLDPEVLARQRQVVGVFDD